MNRRRLLLVALAAASLAWPASAEASVNQWHPLNGTASFAPVAMASLPGHPGSLYTAWYLSGFARSADGGATWPQLGSVSGCVVNTMAVDPNHPMTVYLGCANGVVRTTDGGATWTPQNDGLTFPDTPGELPKVDGIVIDPADPDTIYLTTYLDVLGADIFVSHDAGGSWTPIHTGYVATGITISDGRLYAGEGGVITSDDGGQTWSDPANVDAGGSLVADPANPGTVVALAASTSTPGQAWLTTDGGADWTQMDGAPAHITSGSAYDGHLYLGTLGGVYATTDGGQSWTQSDIEIGVSPSDFRVVAVAADPANPGHVWVGGDPGGVWELTFDRNLTPGSFPYWEAGTLPATDITPTSAVLHGVVAGTQDGATGLDEFSWGTTSAYGQYVLQTAPTDIWNGQDAEVRTTLTGLQPDTTYHYHLDGWLGWWGASGLSRPDDVTFTTPPAQAPSITVDATAAPHGAAPLDQPLPVRIHWQSQAGTYRLCSQALQLSADGGAFSRLARTGPDARGFVAYLEPGHRYAVRVQARDCTGLRSTWSTTSFSLRRLVAAPRVTYDRRWRTSGSGLHVSTARGARVVVDFTGTQIAVLAATGRSLGFASISLDGEPVTRLGLWADHPMRLGVVSRLTVGAGRHRLVIRARSGTAATALQSFEVLG